MSEQPPTYPSGPIAPATKPGSGMAIAALVLGIVSLVLFCFWPVSVPAAVLALIFGVIARGKASRGEAGGKGMATAGLVLSIIAILLLVVAMIAGKLAINKLGPEFEKAMEQGMKKQMSQPSREESETPGSQQSMLPTAVWPA